LSYHCDYAVIGAKPAAYAVPIQSRLSFAESPLDREKKLPMISEREVLPRYWQMKK
jgi:hypothetical protein